MFRSYVGLPEGKNYLNWFLNEFAQNAGDMQGSTYNVWLFHWENHAKPLALGFFNPPENKHTLS